MNTLHYPRLRAVKKAIFHRLRPYLVENLDANEDFACETCGEPVLFRYFYCSDACCDEGEAALREHLSGLPPPCDACSDACEAGACPYRIDRPGKRRPGE